MNDPIEGAIISEHSRQEAAWRKWIESQEVEHRPCPVCGERYGHAFNCTFNQK